MPFPKPDDPDYCAMSRQPVPDLDTTKRWHRCPACHRLIADMPNGTFYPHVIDKRRARRRDAVQEGLVAYGLNDKPERGEIDYAENGEST